MASMILYPPIVDSYAPAFIAAEDSICRIYFSLSKFNQLSDFVIRSTDENGNPIIDTNFVQFTVLKQGSGANMIDKAKNEDNRFRSTGIVLNIPAYPEGTQENLYYFDILNSDILGGWQPGDIYKIQVRLSSARYTGEIGQSAWLNTNANLFSEWSTVCITKAIGEVSFTIPNYTLRPDETDLTVETLNFVGTFYCTDASEKLYSYRVKLLKEGIELEDSKTILTSQYYNTNQISYIFKTEPENNTRYSVIIEYETNNKYQGEIQIDLLYSYDELSTTTIELLSAENDKNNIMSALTSVFEEEEEGRIGLKIYNPNNETLDGAYMIRRADSRDNFATWTDIKLISTIDDSIVYDYLIESGIWYKYGIQKYKADSETVKRGPLHKMENAIMRNFNYSFLLGEDNQQLKLQFDNDLNSFKINISEAKNTTIGGEFPLIARSSANRYITFSLGGLISFNMDENNLFLSKEQLYQFDEVLQLYKDYNNLNGINQYDYIYERDFRKSVIEFLHNGKPKLFKSPSEGNILIYLSDISLTPNKQLGRLIYSFNSQASEIGKPTMENYQKYNIFKM